MPQAGRKLRRPLKTAARNLRGLAKVISALVSTDHPLLAHVIPIRRCNLACKYCNEYDDFSKPVPNQVMFRRVDKLAELGTAVITISGGEPLLHPALDEIIARIRRRGIIAGMITNGYLLVPERIERLNRAGLEWLQISIDNVVPDEVSKKSLKVLDKKLQMLAQHAEFHVNINSVVGGGVHNPQDALAIGKRALELGFSSTVGIIHDGQGQLEPLGEEERRVYHEMKSLEKRSFTRINAWILAHSSVVVQDPSGIPFREFPRDQWTVRFWGRNAEPIEIFKKYEEPELKAAVDAAAPLRIPFGFGYQYDAAKALLIVAERTR